MTPEEVRAMFGDPEEWSVREAIDCFGQRVTVYLRISEFADRYEAFRYHQLCLNDHFLRGSSKLGHDPGPIPKLSAEDGDRSGETVWVGGVDGP